MFKTRLDAALGKIPADLVFKNAKVICTYTEEIIDADVAVLDDVIVGVGQGYEGKKEIDLNGKYLSPGFIDSHLHIESSMGTPERLAEAVIPWGTTTLIADPHELANVKGIDAVRYVIDAGKNLPLSLYVMAPSCVPATPEEESGAVLSAEDLAELKNEPYLLGLGEMMDFNGVISGNEEVCKKLSVFSDRVIDGHAPLVTGKAMQAYRLAGVATDHECATEDEVIEKLRAGFYINIRESSAAKNVETIISAVLKHKMPYDRLTFCTDDKHIGDTMEKGNVRENIRKAISLGVPPAAAYRIATLNAADCYGLKHLGAISPGKRADIVILDDLEDVIVSDVYVGGCRFKGAKSFNGLNTTPPAHLFNTVNLAPISRESFSLKAPKEPTDVLEIVPGQIITKHKKFSLPQENGYFKAKDGFSKIAVIERHKSLGHIGVGAVLGFPINGAIASTVSHDSHNLIVLGDSDDDMLMAANALKECGGGYALVKDGKLLGKLPLPICGLITDIPSSEIEKIITQMKGTYINKMSGTDKIDPFTTLSFLALPVIPEIRMTTRGFKTF